MNNDCPNDVHSERPDNPCSGHCNNLHNDHCNELHNGHCNETQEKETVKYAAGTPYPPVCVERKNSLYARMMLDNAGGNNSEMSAVSLYLYNDVITQSNAKFSQAFHKISVVEMHHLHIFCDLALKLGENPRLWTHKRNHMSYWTPGYNRYPTGLAPMLENAIYSEENAILKYQKQISIIEDCHITDLLKRIIEDEELHIKIYRKLQKAIEIQ